jgi:hypothetical protein
MSRNLRGVFGMLKRGQQRRDPVTDEKSDVSILLQELRGMGINLDAITNIDYFLKSVTIPAQDALKMANALQWLAGMRQGFEGRINELKAKIPAVVPDEGASVVPSAEVVKDKFVLAEAE